MKKKTLGETIIQGLNEAIEYESGKRILETTHIEIPDPAPIFSKHQIAKIRKQIFRVSQPIFAALLNVKPSTVKAWEQGLKTPSGAACRLLQLVSLVPNILTKI